MTLDTGAVVAVERADRGMLARLKEALEVGRRLTLPTVVIAEGWRGGDRSALVAALMGSCVVEPLFESLARRAGETQAKVRGSTAIDAIVVASASARGDLVLTTDVEDLSALASHWTGVDVIAV